MEIAKVYPLDAVYDTPEDVPEDVMLITYDVFLSLSFTLYEPFALVAG